MSSIFSTGHIEESLQASVDTVINNLLKNCILPDTVRLDLTVTGRPIFRYFTPLDPRKFCAPPYLFVFSMCKQKQHKKLTKDKTL
jgi:hypothetical protein